MNKKSNSKTWINALILVVLAAGTFWVLKYGVKKAADLSYLTPRSYPTSGSPAETEESKQNPQDQAKKNEVAETGSHSAGTGSAASAQNGAHSSVSGTTSSGTAAASSEANKNASPVAAATPQKPDSNCFSFEYQHKKEARQKDIEDFLDYSNAFPLLSKNVNEKSICVKVNQKPVAFRVVHSKTADEVVVGSVVGPESVIKVSYCINKVNCTETCAIPKTNRVMDDLMSDAGDEEDFKDSWGDSDETKKKDLKAHVKELRSIASENKDLEKNSVMRLWDTLAQKDWLCKKQ